MINDVDDDYVSKPLSVTAAKRLAEKKSFKDISGE